MKKKIISIVLSIIITIMCICSNVAFATGLPRDPNGDGVITVADAVYIRQYLKGNNLPSNTTALDVDQNGIISEADAVKIEAYDAGFTSILPQANSNDPVTSGFSSSVEYRRHDCSSTNPNSYTSYTLNAPIISPNNIGNETDTIIDSNDMQRDYETAVVRIKILNGGGGSGFIVGPHIIATAAHCVYGSSGFYNLEITIVDENSNDVLTVSPDYIHIPSLYVTSNNYYYSMCYDYALLYVSEDLSQYGSLNLGVGLNQYTEDEGEIYVAGFPAAEGYPSGYSIVPYGLRFHALGNLTDGMGDNILQDIPYLNRILIYDADTYGGDSGGPIYALETYPSGNSSITVKTVIGIHTNGFNETNNPLGFNKGTRVTEELLRFYYKNNMLTS